jgi:optic atrophy protein 1
MLSRVQGEKVESTKVNHLSEGPSARERQLERENKDLVRMMEKKEREIVELRSALKQSTTGVSSQGPKSLIDMYSEVLTLLAEFDAQSKDGRFVDQLPKVVVVGDQSAGKTSVLEMVAGARIFPRGAGEMMTRSPVMVTLSDAADHIAEFRDTHQRYDLTKKSDLKSLRLEIERRMVSSVGSEQTVSSEPVPLTVRGPHMKRMVLVDLPGVISTVTTGMASDTRESIVRMCKRYMQNPNAIIMCIQDGGVDAERSIVTDLVREVDGEGRRTIFVLTKVDLAEKSGIKSERVKSILEGRLFPMKALGYFAVVTGSGNPHESIDHIDKYEKEYFARSKLFQSGTVMEKQLGTRNMVKAVNEEFWKMVKESIHDQTLKFKGLRYRLEAEWRNKFPGERVLDREDLFEMEKANLLREVASLALVTPAKWEDMFYERLWKKMAPYALETILMEASQAEDFSTEVDIALRKWAEDRDKLPALCALAAQEATMEVLTRKIEATKGGPFHALSQGMREFVGTQCLEQLKWSSDNVDQLRSVQITTLEDKDVRDQEQWMTAAEFLNTSLQGQIRQGLSP